MKREELIAYIYAVARDLDVDWSPYFDKFPQSKRIRKGCKSTKGPGTDSYQESMPTRREPNSYAKFVREMMTTYQFPSGTSQTQKMKIIGKEWRKEKTNILDEEHAQDIEREDRIENRKKARQMGQKLRLKGRDRKIPKQGADADLDL